MIFYKPDDTVLNDGEKNFIRRAEEFSELTGLESCPWTDGFFKKFFGKRSTELKGLDHNFFWEDKSGNVLMTTEPYVSMYPRVTLDDVERDISRLMAQWDRVGFKSVVCPVGHGLWNPPTARLFLVTRKTSELRLAPILAKYLMNTSEFTMTGD